MQESVPGSSQQAANAVSSVFQSSIAIGESLGPLIAGFLVDRMPQTMEVTCRISQSPTGCQSGYQWTTLALSLFCGMVATVLLIFLPADSPVSGREKLLDVEDVQSPPLSPRVTSPYQRKKTH